MRPLFLLFLLLTLACAGGARAGDFGGLPPRAVAALEQGQAAEQGIGGRKNFALAITLYCDVAQMGGPEGFFRVGRVLSRGPASLRNVPLANAYLALAASLGHREAAEHHDPRVANAALGDNCGDFVRDWKSPGFDLDAYLAAQPLAKRKIADLIRRHAPRYNVDTRVALSVALAESNFDATAVSGKNAQGVMQLAPVTQTRFGVSRPFDAESSVRGGLAYLKWLRGRYGDDWSLIAAAYNTGEGAVARHKGIPPYPETVRYVRRVLYFAGLSPLETSCSDARQPPPRPGVISGAGRKPPKKPEDFCFRALSF
ncbi:MAG: lytic transglycosylase domain-containing protein [Betaproteobacteria bacterium]|nr:lytic transglycosylase domain-containing protein [Betaproteobacteria bacterium]